MWGFSESFGVTDSKLIAMGISHYWWQALHVMTKVSFLKDKIIKTICCRSFLLTLISVSKNPIGTGVQLSSKEFHFYIQDDSLIL